MDACPFDPPRIKAHPEKSVAFMCDLCRGRAEGPICVEYCNFDALTVAKKEKG
jgi:Fe-S-cluster-containing hydrogenase component 2